MTTSLSASVIGLTGPFGSGCTTAAKILASRRGYKSFLLSSIITDRWKKENPGKVPSRADLQALGNEIRMQSGNPGALAEIAIGELDREARKWNSIVIDGIEILGRLRFAGRDLVHVSMFWRWSVLRLRDGVVLVVLIENR